MAKSPKYINFFLFVLVFGVIFIGRLFLLGSGHLEDTDENPFLILLQHYDQLVRFDIHSWNLQVFTTWSTYLETAIRLVQSVFLKFYADYIGELVSSTHSLSIMAFFNVLVSMLIALIFFKILKKLKFTQLNSLLGVIIYSCFLNSNLYIKHVLPYDTSLLFYLISIYLILDKTITFKTAIASGVFCALGYYTYFGNFVFSLITYSLILARAKQNLLNTVKLSISFAIPSILFLLFFEYLSSLTGNSFISHSLMFSGTIYHGSSDESLFYLFKYLYTVENTWGIVSIILICISIFYLLYNFKSIPRERLIICMIGIGWFWTYSLYSFLFNYMVLYGRILHMYIPFFVITCLVFIDNYKKLYYLITFMALINFVLVISQLNNIGYPRTAVYNKNLFDKENKFQFKSELECGIVYNYKLPYYNNIEHSWPKIYLEEPNSNDKNYKSKNLLLLNFCFFHHYPDNFMGKYEQFNPPSNSKLIWSKLHFMSHPAYTFEYCTKQGREFFLDKKIKLEIYEITKP